MPKKFIILLFSIIILLVIVGWASITKEPSPPVKGPGSLEYNHSQVIKTSYGQGANQYWIYEPSSPKPLSAPVIVFNHGWGVTNPEVYEAWIVHIVRKGNIVIYPRYQENIFTSSDNFTPNAINSFKSALNELNKGNHVRPQLDKFAIVGHSVGGLISVNMAVLASSSGIPQPKAIFSVQPGRHRSPQSPMGPRLENLSKIPENTLLITLSGDIDNITGDEDAIKIFKETTQISPQNKDYIILKSDGNGFPPLFADHLAPLAVLRTPYFSFLVNTLDYYGTWKLFDGLTDAAFYGINSDYALGNTSNQRYMGKWSDGKPVNQMVVIDNP